MQYIGDFAEDATVRHAITTNDKNGGAIAPSSAFAASDLKIFKNGSATEKTSTNGITVTSPFDAETSTHSIEIDTSNDTGDSGFWTTGADYWVFLNTAKTVDGETVEAFLFSFSVENRFTNVNKISGSGPAADNAEIVFATDFASNYDATNDMWFSRLGGGVVHGDSSARLVLGTSTTSPALHITNTNLDGKAVAITNAGLNGTAFMIDGGSGAGFNIDKLTINDALTVVGTVSGLSTLTATTVRSALGLAAANLDTQLAALPTQAEITGGAYALDTDANGRIRVVDGTGTGEISLTAGLIDGITGTKNTLDDLNDISVSGVLTTQMAESYAADGTAPTLTQALLLIQQMLTEFAISGTTWTAKQLDGTTTAATFTLDDATNPTSITRAS